MVDRGTIDGDLADEILDALDDEAVEVRREVVFVRDASGASGKTLRTPQSIATDISERSEVDAVEFVDLGTGID